MSGNVSKLVPDKTQKKATKKSSTTNYQEFLKNCARSTDRQKAKKQVQELTERTISQTGKGLDLTEANLSGLDLSGFDLRLCNLNRALLYSTNLTEANLESSSLICTGTERANFTNANLKNAYVHSFSAQVCDFTNCDLSGLVDATGGLFHGCKLKNAKLSSAVLAGCSFYQCDLTGVSFERAKMQAVSINECFLEDTDFAAAFVAELVITKCSLERVKFSRARGENVTVQRLIKCADVDFSGAMFTGLRLSSFNAHNMKTVAMGASMSHLRDITIYGLDTRDADFTDSMLINVQAEKANASGIALDGAAIRRSNFTDAVFTGAAGENLGAVDSCFDGTDMEKFAGRSATFRNCTFKAGNLNHAYLYRGMITGEPPQSSSLDNASLDGAILVQSYIASSMRNASLHNTNFVYARLNQCNFDKAHIAGGSLYKSSMVKVSFHETDMNGVSGSFFVDRCLGLEESLKAGNNKNDILEYIDNFKDVMKAKSRGST